MSRNGDPSHWIVPTRGAKTLPAVEILTGRGFITGKSGSGKSNTASVIAEELLDNNYNLLIVDTEGEYYGLKAEYELLHVGNDEDHCDVKVGPEHAEKIASVAIEENVPVILDVSDFLDGDMAQELIANVVRELYHKEKDARKPFLLMIEELQEYLPQTGGSSDLAELLERVAKRGRKRGLGMLGMSQRPSSVDKDFITQCDWMVWHLLTWKNDVDVVRNILGSEIADQIEQLDTGQAFLMTDWDDDVEQVKFKRKRTHDAGATPGLESYERPDLKTVSSDLLTNFTDDDVDPAPSDQPAETETAGSATAVETQIEDADLEPSEPEDIPDLGFDIELDDPETELAESDLRDLQKDELVELATALQERNRSLSETIETLRAKQQQAIEKARQQSGRDDGSGTAKASPAPPARPEPTSRRPPAPAPNGGSHRGRPQPPSRPVNRDGLSGNLVEFTAMILYLFRALSYRFRLISYRLRTGPTDERER